VIKAQFNEQLAAGCSRVNDRPVSLEMIWVGTLNKELTVSLPITSERPELGWQVIAYDQALLWAHKKMNLNLKLDRVQV
jgi:hypothetical protein